MFPNSLLKAIRHRVAKRRMREFSDLPIAEAFDRIYERGTWSDGSAELSGGGSYGSLADDYVALLAEFIEEHRIESIIDIGCGDFNIGSRIAGIPELVRERETGVLYPAGDVEALAAALKEFARLPDARLAEWGRAGRLWVEQDFNAATYRNRLVALYESLEEKAS